MKDSNTKPPFSRPMSAKELDAMPDENVDFSDSPLLTEDFWKKARVVLPEERRKTQVTVRLDPDVLGWFKAQGPGYQTRINAVLRSYYEAHAGK